MCLKVVRASMLTGIPSTDFSLGFIGIFVDPIGLAGVLAAGWFLRPWRTAAIVSALGIALVKLGSLVLYYFLLEGLRAFDSEFGLMLLVLIPVNLVEMAAAATFAAMIVFLRANITNADAKKS